MRIVRATNIEVWAGTLDARSMLPGLVRRLVHATGKGLQRVDLPAGEGVQRPGWDGVVIAETATPFVPSGVSLWEACTVGERAKPRWAGIGGQRGVAVSEARGPGTVGDRRRLCLQRSTATVQPLKCARRGAHGRPRRARTAVLGTPSAVPADRRRDNSRQPVRQWGGLRPRSGSDSVATNCSR